MKTSTILAMAGATLIAGSLFGGDLVRAFPTIAPAASESMRDRKSVV